MSQNPRAQRFHVLTNYDVYHNGGGRHRAHTARLRGPLRQRQPDRARESHFTEEHTDGKGVLKALIIEKKNYFLNS